MTLEVQLTISIIFCFSQFVTLKDLEKLITMFTGAVVRVDRRVEE